MANLTFEQKNAKQLLADTFASYGLTDPAFVDAIQKAILDNTDAAGNVLPQQPQHRYAKQTSTRLDFLVMKCVEKLFKMQWLEAKQLLCLNYLKQDTLN